MTPAIPRARALPALLASLALAIGGCAAGQSGVSGDLRHRDSDPFGRYSGSPGGTRPEPEAASDASDPGNASPTQASQVPAQQLQRAPDSSVAAARPLTSPDDAGPEVATPRELGTTEQSVVIRGWIYDESGVLELSIDTIPIPIHESGVFEVVHDVPVGVSMHELRAVDSLGNITTAPIVVTRNPEEAP